MSNPNPIDLLQCAVTVGSVDGISENTTLINDAFIKHLFEGPE